MDKKKPTIKTKPKKEKRASSSVNNKNTVILISVVLAITISLGAYFFMIKAQLDQIGPGSLNDLDASTANLEAQRKTLAQLKTLQENFDAISADDISLLSNILPSEDAVPELLAQLEVIALNSGVDLTRVSLSEVAEEAISARQKLEQEVGKAEVAQAKGVKEVLIQMELDAFDYASFKKFIESLESHTRLLDVETFNFQTENERQRVTAKTFYFPE